MSKKNGIHIIVLALLLLYLMGCAGLPAKNSGRIAPDQNVTAMFSQYQVSSDMTYYISGSDVYPNAILGINKMYSLDPATLWKSIEMTPQTLETLVGRMQDRARYLNRFQYGAVILDNQGKQIGIWYSMLEAITAVFVNGNTVVVYTPDIDTYNKYEDGKLR